MYCQLETPVKLPPEMLDDFLFRGWFRMGQNIFTTNFLNFKGQFYSAIWLRVHLPAYQGDNTERKLRKLNARFTVHVRPATITEEKEELFARYRSTLAFEASASVRQLLFGKATLNVFDTREVVIYDGDQLVACGFFDLGYNSAAGITSFYDPQYKKHSLGKYLIYLKMNFCKEAGLEYFYPGYFVPGYSFFDYKLTIGKKQLEFLDFVTEQWSSIEKFSPILTPIRIMKEKLDALQIGLARKGIETQLFRYEFFEANLLPELKDAGLFDIPLFLFSNALTDEEYFHVIVYDLGLEQFRLVKCRSLWTSNLENANGVFSSNLLKEEGIIAASVTADDIIVACVDLV